MYNTITVVTIKHMCVYFVCVVNVQMILFYRPRARKPPIYIEINFFLKRNRVSPI